MSDVDEARARIVKSKRAPRRAHRCAVCQHVERTRIEYLLAGGISARIVGERFGVHRMAVWRHWTTHVSPEAKAALFVGPAELQKVAERAAEEGRGVFDYLAILRGVLTKQLLAHAEVQDWAGVNALTKNFIRVNHEIASISGELARTSPISITNNLIINSPFATDLIALFLDTVRAHPEIRVSFLASLDRLYSQYSGAAPPPAPGRLINAHAEAVAHA